MNRKWIGFSGILVGMSASALMQTLVATSLPVIERDLGGMALYSWVFAGYMLASTISIPLFARLADVVGRRTLYVVGILVFLIGSALVGASQSMELLVAFRVLQGIGAGAVAPAALASIGDLFSDEERGKIFGIIGAVQVLANLIGPPLGGWITDTFSWRWGFYLILPVGLLAMILAALGLQDKMRASNWRTLHIDWIGALLIGSGLFIGLLGFQQIGLGAGHLVYGIALCVGTAVLLNFAVQWEQKQAEPVIPIALLSHPSLWRATLGTLLLGFVTNSAVAYFPLYLEKIYEQTATSAGLALLPMLLMAGVASGVGGALANGWPRQAQAAAWVLIIAGFLSLTVMKSSNIGWMTAVIGAGMGLLLPVYLQLAQQAGGDSHLATASGLVQLARNLGGAMGIPLLGIWLLGGEVGQTAFSFIFATLTTIGFAGLLLGLISPRPSVYNEHYLPTD
ncbi:MAG: MFS transporter [Ardenticatenaceae bacterium]|nr:MFS transporter [Ardenticatenaceae bacterium]MCB8991369.1 MFS transporter [Ardenticatenaceae bacterium]MCB9003799.1 MFS transporter [Ardenticatenaceae bacterium]